MPRELFTEDLLAKFAITHGTPKAGPHRGSNRVWALTASRGLPPARIRVTFPDWLDIVRLVERQSYRLPNDFVGLAGGDVRLFAEALARGLDKEELTDPLREAATRVLDFVRGDGRNGFKMQSQWG
jgi:hypothetical protein